MGHDMKMNAEDLDYPRLMHSTPGVFSLYTLQVLKWMLPLRF